MDAELKVIDKLIVPHAQILEILQLGHKVAKIILKGIHQPSKHRVLGNKAKHQRLLGQCMVDPQRTELYYGTGSE